MNKYTEAAPRRNREVDYANHHVVVAADQLTPAGRVVWRRTGWSSPYCNMIADLAGLGPREAR